MRVNAKKLKKMPTTAKYISVVGGASTQIIAKRNIVVRFSVDSNDADHKSIIAQCVPNRRRNIDWHGNWIRCGFEFEFEFKFYVYYSCGFFWALRSHFISIISTTIVIIIIDLIIISDHFNYKCISKQNCSKFTNDSQMAEDRDTQSRKTIKAKTRVCICKPFMRNVWN